jgi:hypothetical protein
MPLYSFQNDIVTLFHRQPIISGALLVCLFVQLLMPTQLNASPYRDTLVSISTLTLICIQIMHVIFHWNVVLLFGKPPSRTEFHASRIYFLFDGCSPSVDLAFLYLLGEPVKLWLTFLVVLSFLLHLFYVLQWTKWTGPLPSLVEWSSASSWQERLNGWNAGSNVAKLTGTGIDAVVHFTLLYALIAYSVH